MQAETDDPLDAFMAEMQQLVDEQKTQAPKKERADLGEEEDNVADFLEVQFPILPLPLTLNTFRNASSNQTPSIYLNLYLHVHTNAEKKMSCSTY